MTKAELITQVSERAGLPKTIAKASLEATIAAITEALARGEEVKLVGFGTFGARPRRPSQRRHIKTCQTIPVASKVTPRFKPGKPLKKLMADKLAVVQLPSGRLIVKPRASGTSS